MADLSSNPDNLIAFLERVAANQKANIANFPIPYDLLRRVDNCLATAGKNLINPKPVLAGLMLLRCQYAYKAAAGMALSGQAVEAFVMMRSCLEHAGYALAIFQDPHVGNGLHGATRQRGRDEGVARPLILIEQS